MGKEELQRIIEKYEDKNHFLLAAADLAEYAKEYADEIKNDKDAINFCRTLAYKFVTKNMLDSARSLYRAFGMDLEEINILTIKEARKILGVEEKMEGLKQKAI